MAFGEIRRAEFAGMQLQPAVAAPLQRDTVVERQRRDLDGGGGAGLVVEGGDEQRLRRQRRHVDGELAVGAGQLGEHQSVMMNGDALGGETGRLQRQGHHGPGPGGGAQAHRAVGGRDPPLTGRLGQRGRRFRDRLGGNRLERGQSARGIRRKRRLDRQARHGGGGGVGDVANHDRSLRPGLARQRAALHHEADRQCGADRHRGKEICLEPCHCTLRSFSTRSLVENLSR